MFAGSQVDVSFLSPTQEDVFQPGNPENFIVNVGPGIEVVGDSVPNNGIIGQSVDIDDNTIRIIASENGTLTEEPFNGISISDINNALPPIESATLRSSQFGHQPQDVTFTDDTVFINNSGLNQSFGDEAVIDIGFASVSADDRPNLNISFGDSPAFDGFRSLIVGTLEDAWDQWANEFTPGVADASIELRVNIGQESSSFDAFTSFTGSKSTGQFTSDGKEIATPSVVHEIMTGEDLNGPEPDAILEFRSPLADIFANQDFAESLLAHELGHPLGIVAFNGRNNATPFEANAVDGTFDGPRSGSVPIAQSASGLDTDHLAEGLMSPYVDAGERVTERELSILADLGLPIAGANPENQQPNVVSDEAVAQAGVTVTIDVLANDSDPDGNTLSLSSVDDPSNGQVAITPGDQVSYTPDDGFTGMDSFTYTVSDGEGGIATGTVEITVDPFNFFNMPAVDQVAAVYIGYFGRAPDAEGRNFWAADLNDGVSQGRSPAATAEEMASGFRFSDEAQGVYPFLDPTVSQSASPGQIGEFVSDVFDNLFNRTPDAAGNEFWIGEIQDRLSSGQTIGDVIVDVMTGASGTDVTTLQNKIDVANAYTNMASTFEAGESVQLIGSVDATQASVDQALTQIG